MSFFSYSFEHVRDADGRWCEVDTICTTAVGARTVARSLAARGFTFSVLRTKFADDRWFRGWRRRQVRRGVERWCAWMIPSVLRWMPDRWWRR
jgi:hypothetical protein